MDSKARSREGSRTFDDEWLFKTFDSLTLKTIATSYCLSDIRACIFKHECNQSDYRTETEIAEQIKQKAIYDDVRRSKAQRLRKKSGPTNPSRKNRTAAR